MELTVFDWIVITIVGLSGVLALFRGFIREVLSLGAWLVAAFTTIHFYDDAKLALAKHIGHKLVVTGLATLGLFILVLIVCSIVNAFILRFLRAGGDISILDSALGMVFGVARGLFILALAYVMFAVIIPKDQFPDMVKNARTLPLIEASAGALEQIAPGYSKRLEQATEQAAEEGERMAREKATEEAKKMHKDPAKYDADQRQDLERLLDTLQREQVKPQQPNTPNTQSR